MVATSEGAEEGGAPCDALWPFAQALASPSERGQVRLDALFGMTPDAFIKSSRGLAYAMARYACQ